MSFKKQDDEEVKHLLELPSQFESDRLLIKKFNREDSKGLLSLLNRNDNREFLRDSVDEATEVHSLEDAENRLQSLSADFDTQKRFVMGIWLKETNIFIGNIWIEPKNWDLPSFEIGYYLDQGYTKKGIATEAVKRSITYIFEELRAHKIIIITRDYNDRSYKLAERLNFTKEGHFRECNIDGERRFGLLHYGLLKSEYDVS